MPNFLRKPNPVRVTNDDDHDFFNLISVLVLFPLQLTTGFLVSR